MPPSCAVLGGFAIGAQVALLWQHYGDAWQSPAVIRQAHRTPHAVPRTTHAGEDSPRRRQNRRACCVCRSISSILRGVATRTRNVSEYACTCSMPSHVFWSRAHLQRHVTICLMKFAVGELNVAIRYSFLRLVV